MKLYPTADILLTLEPGEHGFDTALHLKDTPWLQEGMKFVEKSLARDHQE